MIDDGETPDFQIFPQLSSALDLHLADLLVMANVRIPEELAPLDSEAGGRVPDIVHRAVRLSSDSRNRLLEFARSLPQRERTRPVPEPKDYERYPYFAAVLGISAGDLSAVGGMEINEGEFPVSPVAAELSMLIWETRRLAREQVWRLGDEVASMS
jgi:hypothetical protein